MPWIAKVAVKKQKQGVKNKLRISLDANCDLKCLGDFGFSPPFLNKPNVNPWILLIVFQGLLSVSKKLSMAATELCGEHWHNQSETPLQEVNRLVFNLSVMPLCQWDGGKEKLL